MDLILSFLAKKLDKHGITLVHITYPPLGTSKAGQGNNQGKKGPGQSDDWILSHRQSLILIRFTHVVANFIYLAERDRPNLR